MSIFNNSWPLYRPIQVPGYNPLFVTFFHSDGMQVFRECMIKEFTDCDQSLQSDIVLWADEYKDRICDGDKLKYGDGRQFYF